MKRKKRNKDRLSELPEHILHHIFSFLPTKFALQTCSLSKKWRHFWVSIPYLSFHLNEMWKNEQDISCSMNYFLKFLYLRDNSSSIQRLHLHLMTSLPVRFENCLCDAIRLNNIRELDITLGFHGTYLTIPSDLFTSSSLGVFKLKNLYGDFKVEFPKSLLSAAHLKTLELENIELPDWPNSEGEVVFSCPVLEILVMVNCCINLPNFLSISTHQLKKLVIDDSGFECKDEVSPTSGLVELHAPNLLSFVHRGAVCAYVLPLENLSELVSAEICAFTKAFDEEQEGRGAVRVLNCLCNSSTLALEGFERFTPQVTNLLGEALTSFTNLKTLELRTTIDDVGFLLSKCSFIETLVLLFTKKEKKGHLVLPKQCMLNNLKCVVGRRVSGLNSELCLLRFLLENAVVLERMTISGYALNYHYPRDQTLPTLPREALTKFGDKLCKLSRKFPTVELSFRIL